MRAEQVVEYRAVLGLSNQRVLTPDIVRRAFHRMSLQHHPDKNNNSPEATAMFERIKDAYDYLYQRAHTTVHRPGSAPETAAEDIIDMALSVTLGQSYTGTSRPMVLERSIVGEGETRRERETVYVDVPEGTDQGEMIVLKGKGNIAAGRKQGDVRVFIQISSSGHYERRGLDLHCTRHITLVQALCGFSMSINHPSGRQLDSVSQPGCVIGTGLERIIRGQGMKRGRHAGDLVITFKVEFPATLPVDLTYKLKTLLESP